MRQSIQVSLDKLGNILLPASLRKQLGLKPGMTLVVEAAEKGAVQLRVQDTTSSLIEKEGLLVFGGELQEDVSNIIQEERARCTRCSIQ